MKKIVTFTLLTLWLCGSILAQMPLPCLRYENSNITSLQSFNGSKSTECLQIDMYAAPVHLNDNNFREYTVGEGHIEPGFSYTPTSPTAGLNITLGTNSEMQGAWFEPINYFPQLYEKIEWGVKLPDAVEQAIDNWIHNDQFPLDPPLTPALNPFDPEQIDLNAIIDGYPNSGGFFIQPINGFFYREYERLTVFHNPNNNGDVTDDPDTWKWDDIMTPYRFRFRWSSTVEAMHSVRIILNVPSMGTWEMAPFEFQSYWGDPRNSFVSVSNNGHFFKTDDGHVYMPIGLNINEATFGCNCMEDIGDTDVCEDCYEWGLNDPCCGIRSNKRHRAGISPEFDINGNSLGVQGYTLDPAAYVKLERILETLKNKGGNALRTLIDPTQFDIEFEKLNNYLERQYQAWELDNLVSKCEELDLRIEFNMLIHYAITYHPGGYDKFDWDFSQNCDGCGDESGNNGTHGYCYWNELGLDSPLEFLTDPIARENYKKKLRYMIARWGYSKNIFLFELVSEINNIGVAEINEENIDLNGDGDSDDLKVKFPSLYNSNAQETRPAVWIWHNEMATYIKDELHHTRHLISADYAGPAPMGTDLNADGDNDDYDIGESESPCMSGFYDRSWHLPSIDVMSYSNYSDGFNRWEKMANHDYSHTDQTGGLICGWTAIGDDYVVIGYQNIPKPVVFAETGYTYCLNDDYTGFVKDIIAGVMSGHASSGMSWDEWSSTEHWDALGHANHFMEEKVFNSVDIGSGEWVPGYSLSESDDEFNENGHDDERAEVVYLRNTSQDHPKIFGVIMNRTWNFYTMGGNSCHTQEMQDAYFAGDKVSLDNVVEVGWGNEKLFIRDMPIHQYTIRYYHPVSGQEVNDVNRNAGITGRLGLEDYPLMHDGSNGHYPYYFFLAFKEGEEFEGMTEESSLIESVKINTHGHSEENVTFVDDAHFEELRKNSKTILYPNPANSAIQISTLEFPQYSKFVIRDVTGRIVLSDAMNDNSHNINISALCSGSYLFEYANSAIPFLIAK